MASRPKVPAPTQAMLSTWAAVPSTSVFPSAQPTSTAAYAATRNTSTQKRTVQSLDCIEIVPNIHLQRQLKRKILIQSL